MIKLNHVYFKREDRMILSDIHFQMKPREHWVILGKNGSGKSTILELINGYHFPTSGQVEVLGNVYGTCDIREVRRNIGYISQNVIEKMTLRDPVWEIVATGYHGSLRIYEKLSSEVVDMAMHHLETVRIVHLAHQPFGLLSQGERKKVLLARALMSEPSLLIMDEPCAGLDLYERENFLSALEQFDQRNIGMVYVTHHIEEIMPVFTHVLLLNEGKIVASGKKRNVLTPEFIYEAYQVHADIQWVDDRPWIQVTQQRRS